MTNRWFFGAIANYNHNQKKDLTGDALMNVDLRETCSLLNIATLVDQLQQVDLRLDGEEIADILYLAIQMGKVSQTAIATPAQDIAQKPIEASTETSKKTELDNFPAKTEKPPDLSLPSVPNTAPVYLPPPQSHQPEVKTPQGLLFKAPTPSGLRHPLSLARALRPLMRKADSRTQRILDEEATVTQVAERGTLIPVLKPAQERWLDLTLVIEEFPSIPIWQEIIAELQKLIELQGAFRYIRIWRMISDEDNEIQLFSQQHFTTSQPSPRSPKELLDPTGRSLVILISDCTSVIWRLGKIYPLLKLWSDFGILAIAQLLPERLWSRTALGNGFPVQLNALAPGLANKKLTVNGLPIWEDINLESAIALPIVTLEAESLKRWSQVIAGVGSIQTAGILLELDVISGELPEITDDPHLTPAELVNRFRTTATPTARRLAGLMSVVPINLPIIHLIQQTLLPESMQIHVAEVFMSGLLEAIVPENQVAQSEMIQYKFVDGVKELLIDSVPIPDIDLVLEGVSQYIASRVGLSIKSFIALLSPKTDWNETIQQEIQPFAKIAIDVLRRWGGEYAALAIELDSQEQTYQQQQYTQQPQSQLQYEVESGQQQMYMQQQQYIQQPVSLSLEEFNTGDPYLQVFEFEVGKIEVQQTGSLGRETEVVVKRYRQQAKYFIEDLENGVQLEMVAIPGGKFIMGAPIDELQSGDDERPQHQVTVPGFFMGKYPVTQAQWRVVSVFPQVNRELNPDPSRFKGDNRPVERVSWYDAVEFCDRLSLYTKREYRLPSEAEWEYGCRGGTTTPFHFGETITTEVANYDGNYIYGKGVKGECRAKTTEVGKFGLGNEYGLHDMHGNIHEWCLDDWHNSYEGAPKDGRAWTRNENLSQKEGNAVLRGGSLFIPPWDCRSASRDSLMRVQRGYINYYNYYIGFRVVCGGVGRTL